MQIEILEFLPNEKGAKKGNFDVKIIHTSEKSETFRNMSYFVKDGKKWITISNCMRGDKWLPTYSREPDIKGLFGDILNALVDYLDKNSGVSVF